jgi:hypothetical protein
MSGKDGGNKKIPSKRRQEWYSLHIITKCH